MNSLNNTRLSGSATSFAFPEKIISSHYEGSDFDKHLYNLQSPN